jgi:putative ABC transport system permease protein
MLKSYFLSAWRGLVKNRVYSFINLMGLATGMAVVILISLWIQDELNYNKGFANYDHIVRVMVTQTNGNDVRTNESIPLPLVGDLRNKYPGEFKEIAATSWNSGHILRAGDKQLSQAGMFVQPEMIDILSLRTIDGRKASLDDPSSILVNQSLAEALFGSGDATGKVLRFDDSTVFRVAGVFANLPYSSEFREVNYFAPWANYRQAHPWVRNFETVWNDNSFQAFALLQDRRDAGQAEAKVKHDLDGHGLKDKSVVLLHPMDHWHLYNNFVNGKNVQGAIVYVWMFGAIGLFVLLLACINFMNLSTARSEKRAKEVGIRKSVGSGRGQLIGQFLGESVFLALVAFGLGVLMVALVLPWFNQVADKQMQILWDSPRFWGIALGGTLVAGLLAGSYPAFYLSSFNAVKVLKGDLTRSRTRWKRGTKLLPKFTKAGRAAVLPRQVLIVLQFTVSVALIVCTIIVYQQIVNVKNRPVGYAREGLVTVDVFDKGLQGHFQALRQELVRSGVVADATLSSSPMTDIWNDHSAVDWEGKDPNLAPTFAAFYNGFDYGRTVHWDMVAGRDFSPEYPSDSLGIVLNESAVGGSGRFACHRGCEGYGDAVTF